MKSKEFFLELAETFVVSLAVLLLLYGVLAFPEIVSGASMEPLLVDGNRILVEKVSKNFKPFERGDVVVFHPPDNDNIDYVKRVIGIPGDVIKIDDCKVYITRDAERFVLEEPYLYNGICTEGREKFPSGRAYKVQEGEYLLLGDNREKSADSRSFGFIKKEQIIGKVVCIFWPFKSAKFI